MQPIYVQPPEKPFWKSGGGIALIIVGGVLVACILGVFGCMGLVGIGASKCSGPNPPASCGTSTSP